VVEPGVGPLLAQVRVHFVVLYTSCISSLSGLTRCLNHIFLLLTTIYYNFVRSWYVLLAANVICLFVSSRSTA
jgi:hypothetical protein